MIRRARQFGLVLGLLSSAGHVNAEQAKFRGTTCVAFDEFREGLFASDDPTLASKRKQLRPQRDDYAYLTKGFSVTDRNQANQLIEADGFRWEAEYLRENLKHPDWSGRKDFKVMDLCLNWRLY